jgi:hypothetical protein
MNGLDPYAIIVIQALTFPIPNFSSEDVKDMRVVVGQGSLHVVDAEEHVLEIEKLILHPSWE